MESKIKLLVSGLGENRVRVNIDLSEYLQTGLGGLVQAFYIATTTRELIKSVNLCKELKIPFLVIGAGSKIAISLQGVHGLAIKNRSDNLKIFGIKGKVSRLGIGIEEALVEADSGVSLARLADFASVQGLGGFQLLSDMPGTVGGSFHINPNLSQKAHEIRVLTETGSQKIKTYQQISRQDIILSVVFKLKASKI